ncbi:MAG: NosD domain-containing protein [Candidatus Heimdallarchaeaceae archaeon]
MKKKKAFIKIFFVCLLLVSPYISSVKITTSEDFSSSLVQPFLNYDDPISITNDNDFGPSGYNFIGSGTSVDPYIIENLAINNTNSVGIYIFGTTKYFLIRNCTIAADTYGINIDSVQAATAEVWNCTITGSSRGIYIYNTNLAESFNNTILETKEIGIYYDQCDLSYIYNNTVAHGSRGIKVEDSYHPYVYYNYVFNNTQEGILAEGSDEIVIQHNVCDDNLDGIHTYSCFDPFVGNNDCSDNKNRGIYIRYSDYARVGGNNFHACGLGVYDVNLVDLLTLQVTSNYIDGSLIYYGENLTSTNIWVQYSQFILINCSDVQISSQPAISESLYEGISLQFCKDVTIRWSYISECYYGIAAINSQNIYIENNTMWNNDISTVLANVFVGRIQLNYISNGTIGTFLLDNVDNFTVLDNTYSAMAAYGLAFQNSDNNVAYHNNFINCGALTYGYDDGTNNFWYNVSLQEGNYWSNWVSGAYAIDGPAGSMDLYPLSSQYNPPPLIGEFGLDNWIIGILLVFLPIIITSVRRKKQ